MTVIVAMRFNKDSGVLVGDEQSSSKIRKYDISRKIHEIKINDTLTALIGGSGGTTTLYEVSEEVKRRVGEAGITSSQDFAYFLQGVLNMKKRGLVRAQLENTFGLSEWHFQTGTAQLGEKPAGDLVPDIQRFYSDMLKSKEFYNSFLILSYSSDGLALHLSEMHDGVAIQNGAPYDCIGSGSDVADVELLQYVRSLPREKRTSIDPVVGLFEVLSAVDRANSTNVGVGGAPLVGLIDKGEITFPVEDKCRLALEVVTAARDGFLKREFAYAAVSDLMYQGKPFDKVEEKMWAAVGDKRTELSRFLRGYRS